MISKKESDALNLIRWLSTLSIVICHILQGYDNLYAWIFNLGVQVFFFLSGFLYGNKYIEKPGNFYKNRLIKLYLPYLIWIIVSLVLLYCFAPDSFGYKDIIMQLLMQRNLAGLNHLWFMYVIFLCYLILPIVDYCLTKNQVLFIILFGFLTSIMLVFKYSPTYLWVSLYYVGYLCGRYSMIQKYVLIISTIVTTWIFAYCEYDLYVFKEISIWNNLLHASTGALIFLVIFLSCKKIKLNTKISHLLTNRGGYEVYLTHHIFILGPVSLLFLTPYGWLNITIILLITFLCTYLLIKVTQKIQSRFITKY